MICTVKPSLSLKGKIQLPASKSYSIRAFIIAACGGPSKIINPSDCDDAVVARETARLLGAKVVRQKNNVWTVVRARRAVPLPISVNVKESGTVLRFLLPLLCLRGQKVVVTGAGTLKGRPNLFLTRTLRTMGMDIRGQGDGEGIPIQINGGMLAGGKRTIDASLSSQFISALLIACPQLTEDTHLVLKGKTMVSGDYITMTRQVLAKSKIQIGPKGKAKNTREYRIKGSQIFRGLKTFAVPSDYGLAAFHMAAAVLISSDVMLKGHLKDDLIQADGHILRLMKKMGAKFQKTSKSIKIKGPCVLRGGDFSLKECPDLVPIMAVLALFARGKTRLKDIQHARVKESDRISDLRMELLKIGADIREKSNELIIYPKENYLENILLDPHHDHRLAMAFCVLGLKLGVRVKDIECTRKSYPQFIRDFKCLGVKVKS